MPDDFNFSIEDTWENNLQRLKEYLAEIDPDCAEMLFKYLYILEGDSGNARRGFNSKVLDEISCIVKSTQVTES